MNKNIKIFINYFLGPLLFAWLLFSIYRQVMAQPQLPASWLHIKASLQSYKLFYLLIVVVLMGANWGIEARKWQLSVNAIHPVTFFQSFKAVLSGVSFSVTLPNRIGEYAGRMLFLPDGKRLKAISVTLVGSISQLLVTLVIGGIGLLVLRPQLLDSNLVSDMGHRFIVTAVFGVALILTLLYFGVGTIGRMAERWLRNNRFLYLVQAVKLFRMQLLVRLLLLSTVRYAVFIVQYYLLFSLFDVAVSAGVALSVMSVIFLTMAVIPTIALIELGLRGKVSLHLMGLFTANSLGILLTSVTVWFINLIVPALVGSLLILSVKVFKRKYENE